jgi:hypothetical protein
MLLAPFKWILACGLLLFIATHPAHAGTLFVTGMTNMLDFGLTIVTHLAGAVGSLVHPATAPATK